MTILVTGATGRIGRHVVRAYLADGAAVRALVLPDDPGGTELEAAGAEVVVGELTDRTALARATDGVAVVCHLAAALTSRGHGDDDFFESNLRGTYELLQAVRADALALRRLVYVSSDAVYWSGLLTPADFLPVDETHPRRPGSVYGATKLGAEELCLTFQRAYGVPVSIMRPTATADAAELLEREGPFGRRLFVRGMIAFLERQPSLDEASRVMLDALRRIDDGRERVYVVADPTVARAARRSTTPAMPPTACAASRPRMRPWARRSISDPPRATRSASWPSGWATGSACRSRPSGRRSRDPTGSSRARRRARCSAMPRDERSSTCWTRPSRRTRPGPAWAEGVAHDDDAAGGWSRIRRRS